MSYRKFIKEKEISSPVVGFDAGKLNDNLFDFQEACTRWAIKKGKAALFEDCGLGKTLQQLVWADAICKHTKKPVILLAPIAVGRQTHEEGIKFGIKTNICECQDNVKPGINITNYQKLHRFKTRVFSGVVLDESSILKSFTGKYRNYLIDAFRRTPYRLACTATPAPNDFVELGNHSEFLGIMSRSEMLSMFFINDTGDTGTWRLKKHAEFEFWKWVCSWAITIRKPSDLGFSDTDFVLPKITYKHIAVKSNLPRKGLGLIAPVAKTLTERRTARKSSMDSRVQKALELVNKKPDVNWLIWCDLNAESDLLKQVMPDSVVVRGSDTDDHKANSMLDFAAGNIGSMVTKPSICGFGMNFQSCWNQIFVGVSDSYEKLYQAIRRSWRFGQKHPVNIYIIYSEAEKAVLDNIMRKAKDADKMANETTSHTIEILKKEILGTKANFQQYKTNAKMETPKWLK